MSSVKVALPVHLRTLASVEGEVELDVGGQATIRAALDALEARYPMLRGTIRDHGTGKRRAFIRYYAAGVDMSHESVDTPLPEAVTSGRDAFCVIGAIAGG